LGAWQHLVDWSTMEIRSKTRKYELALELY